MAKKSKRNDDGPAVASLNPDDMLSGGLKDDFRGKVIEAVYADWDYEGKIEEPVLAARLTIMPEGEDEPIVQHWSAGDLANFVPSLDGKEQAEADDEGHMVGPFALRVGKRAGLNNNTNFAHLMSAIVESGEASKKFTRKDLTASLDCLEGLDAHWNRVPQKKRSGLVTDDGEGERKRANDVLVVTEVYGYNEDAGDVKSKKVKAKAKAAEEEEEDDEEEEAPVVKKAAKKPAKPVKEEEEDDEEEAEEEEELDEEGVDEPSPLDQKLIKIVMKAIKTGGGKVKKGKLPTAVLNGMAQDKDKSKAVKRVTTDEFLEAGPWNYDEDTGTISASEDDE